MITIKEFSCCSYVMATIVSWLAFTPTLLQAQTEATELVLTNAGRQWILQVMSDGTLMIHEDGVGSEDDPILVEGDLLILGSTTIDGDLNVTGQVDPQTVDYVPGNKVATTGESRYYEGTINPNTNNFEQGDHYVGFKAPDDDNAVSASQIWELPAADGTNGQLLSTNGAGELGWVTNGGIQNLWETMSADAGSAVANSPTDNFTISGAGIVSTSITGDILTVSATEIDPTVNTLGKTVLNCGNDQIAKFSGTDWVCDVDTNTQLTEAQVDSFVDNNGFLTSEVDGDPTNELQNLAEVYARGVAIGNAVQLTATSGDIRFFNDGATSSEMLFLDEDTGRVGIGTNTPMEKFHVLGNGLAVFNLIENTTNNGNTWVGMKNDAIDWLAGVRGDTNDTFMIWQGGVGPRLAIDTLGRVGIGTDSPLEVLHILRNGPYLINLIESEATDSNSWVGMKNDSVYWLAGVRGDTNDTFMIYPEGAGSRLAIDTEGKVGIGTTSPGNILTIKQNSGSDPIADAWTTYSSCRWKANVAPIARALDKIQRLRGVTFNWKDDGRRDIGLIAEEVGAVIPEVVAYEDNGIDAKSIDYARLVAILIEGVKEQQVQIEQLKTIVCIDHPEAGLCQ